LTPAQPTGDEAQSTGIPLPAQSSSPMPWPTIPGYLILKELGRGGMGVVYQAQQIKANRLVALKMILAAQHSSMEEKVRFEIEAEAVARLQHPGIVQLYEVGEHGGQPYFSLEFCPGGSLDQKLRGTPLPPAEAAALVETLALSMNAAHQAGVIHRDLKPANVLLDKDGRPKVTDFGLAKKVDEASQTASGAVMGTPSYMAPEQARGRSKEVGPAADIYALGAVLYECLTGRPPFKAATAMETMLQVMGNEPVPPSRLNEKAAGDLEIVCLKCLEKEPRKRYGSALDLAEELRRFQAGEPITARSAGRLERAWKWSKRRPALAALLAVSLLAVASVAGLAVGLAFALVGEKDARGVAEAKQKETNEALVREKETLAKQKVLLSEAGRTYCELSEREFKQGNVRDSLNWMLRAYETAPEDDPWRQSYLRLLGAQGQTLGRPCLHGDKVRAVAFSPDGRTVLTGSEDGTARLWEAATGKEIATLRHASWVYAVAFSPDGRTALTGSQDGTARLWDAASGQERVILRHAFYVGAVAYSPDGRTVLTESSNWDRTGTARLWDATTGKELHTFRHAASVRALAFSPNGRAVLTGSWDRTARLWDVASGQEVATFRHNAPVVALAFSPDGRTVLTGSGDKTARLWEAASGKELHILRHDGGVDAVAFSPDGRTALTGSADRTARLWDAASGKELHTLRHGDAVRAVAYSPDGRTVLTGSRDQTARLWDAASGEQHAILRHGDAVGEVAYGPDGRTVLTGSAGQTARLWDTASGMELHTLRHDQEVNAVTLSPDGRTALTGSEDGTARLWDAASGKKLHTLRHDREVDAVALSPDGRTVLTGSLDKTARLWDTASGKLLATLRHDAAVNTVAFSPDGRTALTGSGDEHGGAVGEARLWDAASGKELATLRHEAAVRAVAYSPDGRIALTGIGDSFRVLGGARLWDVVSGKELVTLRHDQGVVRVVAYSPDGRTALTGSGRGDLGAAREARLWEAPSGKEIAILRHDSDVYAVAYSPDGRTALTGSWDKTARLWDAASGKELAILRHDAAVLAAAYSPDGRTVLTGCGDKTARLWDAASGKELAALRHGRDVYAVAFSPDGRTALTGSADKTARLWTLPLPAPDEPDRVRAWVRIRTARCFSEQGPLRDLSHAEWLEQCRQLDALGGDWQSPPDAQAWHRHQAAEAEYAKQWYAAAFHVRRLLAEEPGNSEYLERLGVALYRDGQFAEAVERLDEAVTKHGQAGTVEAQLYLAMAHQRLGHADDARTWLNRAVARIEQTKGPRPQDKDRWQALRKEAEGLLKSQP
jgi:WD40 repeat protein